MSGLSGLVLTVLLLFNVASAQQPPAATRTVVASWPANSEPDLEGYILHWGQASGDYTNRRLLGKVTTTAVTVTEGTWFFALQAYDQAGNNSAFSPEASVTVDVTPPAAPGAPTLQVTAVTEVTLVPEEFF